MVYLVSGMKIISKLGGLEKKGRNNVLDQGFSDCVSTGLVFVAKGDLA